MNREQEIVLLAVVISLVTVVWLAAGAPISPVYGHRVAFEGRVVDSVTHQGVGNVSVSVWPYTGGLFNVVTVTNGTGYFLTGWGTFSNHESNPRYVIIVSYAPPAAFAYRTDPAPDGLIDIGTIQFPISSQTPGQAHNV